jgi:hypothetical protein
MWNTSVMHSAPFQTSSCRYLELDLSACSNSQLTSEAMHLCGHLAELLRSTVANWKTSPDNTTKKHRRISKASVEFEPMIPMSYDRRPILQLFQYMYISWLTFLNYLCQSHYQAKSVTSNHELTKTKTHSGLNLQYEKNDYGKKLIGRTQHSWVGDNQIDSEETDKLCDLTRDTTKWRTSIMQTKDMRAPEHCIRKHVFRICFQ